MPQVSIIMRFLTCPNCAFLGVNCTYAYMPSIKRLDWFHNLFAMFFFKHLPLPRLQLNWHIPRASNDGGVNAISLTLSRHGSFYFFPSTMSGQRHALCACACTHIRWIRCECMNIYVIVEEGGGVDSHPSSDVPHVMDMDVYMHACVRVFYQSPWYVALCDYRHSPPPLERYYRQPFSILRASSARFRSPNQTSTE